MLMASTDKIDADNIGTHQTQAFKQKRTLSFETNAF